MTDDRKTNKADPMAAAQTPLVGVETAHTHGDDPMTDEQAAELRQLCEQTGESFDTSLDREQAAERIKALKRER